jgi:alpha-glucosidase
MTCDAAQVREDAPPARSRLVARRGDLPDLSALLPGLQRRRHRRSGGIASGCPTSPRSGCRRDLDLALLPSPMKDFGYDVSDYCDVDPMFGSAGGFRPRPRRRRPSPRPEGDDRPGALAHSSDQHPWFVESRSNRDNPKADWYVWADAKPDGTPPNNWLSIFGGSAWEWDTGRCQYYMHNFLPSQPDLNFHNPEVQNALLDVVRFWLDSRRRRLPARHDQFLLPFDRICEGQSAAAAGAAQRLHRAGGESLQLPGPPLRQEPARKHRVPQALPCRAGRVSRRPPLSARSAMRSGLEILGQYTAGDDRMHMCYAFDFLAPEPLSAEKVREVVENSRKWRRTAGPAGRSPTMTSCGMRRAGAP